MPVPRIFSRQRTADSGQRSLTAVAFTLALAIAPLAAKAQITLTHTEDAAPIPRGTARFRITTGWSRYDAIFTDSGKLTLSAQISSDSLGPRQLPLLSLPENAFKTLTGNPSTRLTLGRLAAESDVRTVTTPIVLEYGVTSRFSIGVMVPVIQTRRNIHFTMNADSTRLANTGFVAPRLRGGAALTNNSVFLAYSRAADSLSTLLTKCPANPTATGCAKVIANTADATATRDLAASMAAAVKNGLGIDSASVVVAPRAGSKLASAIETQRAAVNTRLQSYLGPTAGTSVSVFAAATDFSYIDLQGRNGVPGLLEGPLGGGLDSLQTTNRLVLGGATFAVRWQLFDRYQYDTLPQTGWQTRAAIGGEIRVESVRPDSARNLGEISPATGGGIGVNGAMDITRGHFAATVAARFDKRFSTLAEIPIVGDPDAFWPIPAFATVNQTLGELFTLDVTPRILLGQWFAIDGLYGLERTGPTKYSDITGPNPCPTCVAFATGFTPNTNAQIAQRLGIGFRYSTINSYLSGATKTPVEVSYLHLQTVSGNNGVNQLWRDQIQLRIYFPLLGKH